MNDGKIFEKDFTDSIDKKHILIKRLNDNASSWNGGTFTRFTSTNECDFILYDDNTMLLYGLELKSTKGNSLSFWRKDFERKDKKKSFHIRKCQILGLEKWSEHKGIYGFVFNFREPNNDTYFVNIKNFINYTSTLSKKSINVEDILQMQPIKIQSTKKILHYKYDTESFFNAFSN